MSKQYFSISEAAAMVHMTTETLRHYDRIGLVKPGKKDEWTGYRYYSRQEIVRLDTIQALRCMELSLQEIKKVLDYDDLEKIVEFLELAEQKADDKIAQLQYSRSKILLAKADYQSKLHGQQDTDPIFTKEQPQRFILLSDTLKHPTLDNLWNYHRHFYAQIDAHLQNAFSFEDMAGIYTDSYGSRLFATCIRHATMEGIKILPAGTYLCAGCTEESREKVLKDLLNLAKRKYHITPEFTTQLIVISGILQWNFQIQVYLGNAEHS